MAYTDLTAAWAYKDLVRFTKLDQHGGNSAIVDAALNNPFFFVSVSNSVSPSTWTKMSFSSVLRDQGVVLDRSNNKVILKVTGIWLIMATIQFDHVSGDDTVYNHAEVQVYKNGSAHRAGSITSKLTGKVGGAFAPFLECLVRATATTDYLELYGWHDLSSSRNCNGWLDDNQVTQPQSYILGCRMGDA